MPYRLEKYNINPNSPIYHQAIHYYDHCAKECNFTEQTMTGKISSINHFLRDSRLDDIANLDNSIILDYVKRQADAGLMPRTINNRTKHVLAMARYYRDIEDIDIPNLKDKKIKKQIEAPSNKRAFPRDIVYEALKYADREAWLLIKIGFDCGLRINEIRQMRLKDLTGNELTVQGKGRKQRFVILSDEVMVRLKDWIKREKIDDYIWRSNYGRHIGRPKSTNTLRQIIRKPFEASGVYKMCPHELRHSYASDLLDLGAPTRSIQHGLGHSSEKITEIYLHELKPGKEAQQMYTLKYSAPAPELR